MSYISVFILIIVSLIFVFSGIRKIGNCKTEKDNEIKNQNIFSGVGLLIFGSVSLILLLYVILIY